MSHEFFRRARAKYFGKVQETKTVADAWQHIKLTCIMTVQLWIQSQWFAWSPHFPQPYYVITLSWCHLVPLVTDWAHLTSIHNQLFTAPHTACGHWLCAWSACAPCVWSARPRCPLSDCPGCPSPQCPRVSVSVCPGRVRTCPTAQWKLLCPGKLRRVSECVARASHFVLPILCLANVLFKSDKWSPVSPGLASHIHI